MPKVLLVAEIEVADELAIRANVRDLLGEKLPGILADVGMRQVGAEFLMRPASPPTAKPASVDRAVAADALRREERRIKAAAKRTINNRKPIAPDDRPVPLGKMARRYGYSPSTLRQYAIEGRFSSEQGQKHLHIAVGERSFTEWHWEQLATNEALDRAAAKLPLTREQDKLIDAYYARQAAERSGR